MRLDVKICGISTPDALSAAIDHGARYVGFVFYPPSPRHVATDLAAQLAKRVPTAVRAVGLFVEPSDEELEAVISRVPLDIIQLHGEETPARVEEVRRAVSMPVMKAIKLSSAEDVTVAKAYEPVADRLLFDAKPPGNVAALPGGNGIAFDWSILAGHRWAKPWMLSGGLTADNLVEAVTVAGATSLDVSSGVEDRPGHKDPAKIAQFLDKAALL